MTATHLTVSAETRGALDGFISSQVLAQAGLPKGPASPDTPPRATPAADAQPCAHHVDLGVGVPHVADDAAVLHPIQVFPGHHVLVACQTATSTINPRVRVPHLFALSFGKRWTRSSGAHPLHPTLLRWGPRTCAGDNDVNLSDDFIEFHEPESIHAKRRGGKKVVRETAKPCQK